LEQDNGTRLWRLCCDQDYGLGPRGGRCGGGVGAIVCGRRVSWDPEDLGRKEVMSGSGGVSDNTVAERVKGHEGGMPGWTLRTIRLCGRFTPRKLDTMREMCIIQVILQIVQLLCKTRNVGMRKCEDGDELSSSRENENTRNEEPRQARPSRTEGVSLCSMTASRHSPCSPKYPFSTRERRPSSNEV